MDIATKIIGYILCAIMLIKSSLVGFALMGMSLAMYLKHSNPDPFLIVLWCILGCIGWGLTIYFLKTNQISLQQPPN